MRFLFKTIIFLLLALLVYGLFLIYQEQSPGEKEVVRGRIYQGVRDISITMAAAVRKAVEKGITLVSGEEKKQPTPEEN